MIGMFISLNYKLFIIKILETQLEINSKFISMNACQKEYIHRINTMIDYVEKNLDQPLNLEILADIASFSPYHFHRIFKAFTGETINSFVRRMRLEKSARLLLNDPDRAISEIAYQCGFNNFSVFCRAFKDHFCVSAQEFRSIKTIQISKISQLDSKIRTSTQGNSPYFSENKDNKWKLMMEKNIAVKNMPSMNLVYTRHVGAFDQIRFAYEKLMKWAGPRGLLNFPETKTVTVYHDDPKVTDLERLRQSACITVNKDVKTEGEFGNMQVPAGKYVVGHFEISDQEFEKAWNTTCLWLSESGYQPDDGYPYELYHMENTQHPENKFIVDICIPVKPI